MTDFDFTKDKPEEGGLFSIITSVKVASGKDYLLPDCPDLQSKIEEVMQLEPYHPKYLVWRVFLYTYLFSGYDIDMAEQFLKDFFYKDRKAYYVPTNETSKTITSYITRTRTTSKSIFNDITAYDFTKVIQASDIFINNQKTLFRAIESEEEFKIEVMNAINRNTFHSIYIAYLLVICRMRLFGFWDNDLVQNLYPKWIQWCDAYKQCFQELQKILVNNLSLYTFYGDNCKSILIRLLDYSIITLTDADIAKATVIYGNELDQIDSLSRSLVIDFCSNFPLYVSFPFDLEKTWDILYDFYTKENQTILDYYRLFLISKHLYNKNMRAIENLRRYLCRNDIGLECIKMKKTELFNANIPLDEADFLLHKYFDDLVARGIIASNRREEVLYAIRQTY